MSFPSERINLAPAAAGEPVLRLDALTPDDAACLGAGFAAIGPWIDYPYPAEILQSYFAARETGAPRFGIFAGASLAGAIGLRVNWLSGPYIQFLGLLPEHQGRGSGTRVLRWVEADARAHGARNLWVAASDFNGEALRFYERSGFQRVAAIEGLVCDGKTEVLLRKKLR